MGFAADGDFAALEANQLFAGGMKATDQPAHAVALVPDLYCPKICLYLGGILYSAPDRRIGSTATRVCTGSDDDSRTDYCDCAGTPTDAGRQTAGAALVPASSAGANPNCEGGTCSGTSRCCVCGCATADCFAPGDGILKAGNPSSVEVCAKQTAGQASWNNIAECVLYENKTEVTKHYTK